MWDKEVNGGNGGARVDNKGGDRSPNFAWEYWNCDNFKFSQKIEGLTPGLYEVSVQGVWREGDGGNQARIVNEGGTLNTHLIAAASGSLELEMMLFTSITLSSTSLLVISTTSSQFSMTPESSMTEGCKFISITRSSGSGSVLDISMADDASLQLTDGQRGR